MEAITFSLSIKDKNRWRGMLYLSILLFTTVFAPLAMAQSSAEPLPCNTPDIDDDNDGLIELCDLEGLDAMRYQLDGTGYRASSSSRKITTGCRWGGCRGYELVRDLDFNDAASYRDRSNWGRWTTGYGWLPIGTSEFPFSAIFNANHHSISNLTIARPFASSVGLFGWINEQAKIDGVALLRVDVSGNWGVGGLVGYNNGGTVSSSYVTGTVRGGDSVGGLVGDNYGPIANSYTNAMVVGDFYVGGLVGCNFSGGNIVNSYTVPSIVKNTDSNATGGLVGYNGSGNPAEIVSSYWDTDVSGMYGGSYGVGLSTWQLQSPTAAASTPAAVYYGWSNVVWDFGTAQHYPALKNQAGMVTPEQRDRPWQPPSIEVVGLPEGAVDEGARVMLSASLSSSATAVPLHYRWEQVLDTEPYSYGTTPSRVTLHEATEEAATRSSVTIEVPTHFVPFYENYKNLVLSVTASDGVMRVVRQLSIVVAKRDNAQIAALGALALNIRELSAPPIDWSSDPDGGVDSVAYQWQIRSSTRTAWAEVPTVASTKNTYTIPEATRRGTHYRVVVRYIDGQGYIAELVSAAIVYEGDPTSSFVETGQSILCSASDIDQDDDGLIELCYLEGLDAMRYQPDGTGYRASSSSRKITTGCRWSGCIGYELVKDLDFNDATSYRDRSNRGRWTTGYGWLPIGTSGFPFSAIFNANHHSISNLTIARPFANSVGLFGWISEHAKIDGVALLRVDVSGNWGVGGLVGYNNGGTVSSSYATGTVRGGDSVGGLVGDNYGPIANSYTNAMVVGDFYVGGLVGCNFSGGNIVNSYTVPSIVKNTDSNATGGLVGYNGSGNPAEIVSSYWDTDVSGMYGGSYGVGLSTWQLQSPTAAASTPAAVYYGWSNVVWDFGTAQHYPALKNQAGMVTPEQRDRPWQPPSIEVLGLPEGAVDEGARVMLSASLSSSATAVPLHYRWEQVLGTEPYSYGTTPSRVTLHEATEGAATRSSVTIEVPTNFVSFYANYENLVLSVTASDGVMRVVRQLSIVVAKRDNAQIAALGAPALNIRELSAPPIDWSSDPDGGVDSVAYQWQIRSSTRTAWAEVPTVADTKKTYTIPEATRRGTHYRVVVRYTDGQGYVAELVSAAIVYEGDPTSSFVETGQSILCSASDIDQDDDGLIELCDLEGLDAMRYQPDGTGYRASSSSRKITTGCRWSGCRGYELVKDLDFNDAASYRDRSNWGRWTTGYGWLPIGTSEFPFSAIFNANHHSISNLTIARPFANSVGLFGWINEQAKIDGVALLRADVSGNWGVGGLVGYNNGGTVSSSYATGTVRGGDSVGGLVGDNYGPIANSYTNAMVVGNLYVGGLVGCNFSSGNIVNSYTVPSIVKNTYSNAAGGLVGYNGAGNPAEIVSSYWDTDVSGMYGGSYGVGLSTWQLQSPTAEGNTSGTVYYGWSNTVWDFGTAQDYPALKNQAGMVMPEQRDRSWQTLSIEVLGLPEGAVDEGARITLSASLSSSVTAVPLHYRWEQVLDTTPYYYGTTSSRVALLEAVEEIATRSSVTIEVPTNFVPFYENHKNLVLSVTAGDGVMRVVRRLSIVVAKRDNGRIAALGAPALDIRELSIPLIDWSGDPDGGVDSVAYQWQIRSNTQTAWAEVSTVADTKNTYTIPEATRRGTHYRVVVRYTDGQGYVTEWVSAAIVYEGDPTLPFDTPQVADETTATHTAQSALCNASDIDQDDDGLIEICYLEGLNAIRYQLDGTGYRANGDAAKITTGCPDSGCIGYELTRDLDFMDDADYISTVNKVRWTTASGWTPIGDAGYICGQTQCVPSRADLPPLEDPRVAFSAEFNGNGYAITNLRIKRPALYQGLFGIIHGARIAYVGVSEADIEITSIGGGLVGLARNRSQIKNSYATGSIRASAPASRVGGLVGLLDGGSSVRNSYASATVKGWIFVGGLIGQSRATTAIADSYAVAQVIGGDYPDSVIVGGLIGVGPTSGTHVVSNSYWDKQASGQTRSAGGIGLRTEQLQSPTTPGTISTEVYYGWSTGDWDFGTTTQYPALKNGVGELMSKQRTTQQHFGLLDLKVSAGELQPAFYPTVFSYLLRVEEADTISLVTTATHSDADISISSDSGFSSSVANGVASGAISLNTTTVITINLRRHEASATYRIVVVRDDQAAKLAKVGESFEYTVSIGAGRNSDYSGAGYEVSYLPNWLKPIESDGVLVFSGTPQAVDISDPSQQTIGITIDNGDGTTRMVVVNLQIDSPTTGTITLVEMPGGVLQLYDQLRDDNGIEAKSYIWEHCPVGGAAFSELEGINGMRYELPNEGVFTEAGTVYRVRTTVVDALGQSSEHTAQIELRNSLQEEEPPKERKFIRIRTKIFLESRLQ